ncbi:MAG: hypothetical protein JXR58_13545 [Bacteroidales bacterium]|nr:hypothetical protein [Bacteroidales bacterium]
MKKSSFIIYAVFLAAFFVQPVLAQEEEKESPFSSGADIMSRYVWRGTDFGGSPSIQPTLEYAKGNLTIGTWGAYATNLPGIQEADIYVSYDFGKKFTLMFTDYFFPNELSGNDSYFVYKQESTGHLFELSAKYNGTEKLPLSLMVATIFYGADAVKNDEFGIPTADIQYSTYIELGYEFKNLELVAGFNLLAPDLDRGESGLYGNYMGFVNIGIKHEKEIKITETFSLPFSMSFITNPQTEKIFLVAGISF